MRRGADKRSSDKLSVSAISQKSRSHAGGVIRGLGTAPTSKKTSDSARAEIGRFSACVITQALLAGFSVPLVCFSRIIDNKRRRGYSK